MWRADTNRLRIESHRPPEKDNVRTETASLPLLELARLVADRRRQDPGTAARAMALLRDGAVDCARIELCGHRAGGPLPAWTALSAADGGTAATAAAGDGDSDVELAENGEAALAQVMPGGRRHAEVPVAVWRGHAGMTPTRNSAVARATAVLDGVRRFAAAVGRMVDAARVEHSGSGWAT